MPRLRRLLASALSRLGLGRFTLEIAAPLSNAVGDAYLEFNLDHKLGSTRSAVKWLADQLDDLKKELNQAELAHHDFKKQNNVLAVPLEDRQNLLTRQIEKLNEHLTEMRVKRMELMATLAGELRYVALERTSRRTGETHPLGGFTGVVDYGGALGPFLPWLEAGYYTGVGRQTVWGKGVIRATVA